VSEYDAGTKEWSAVGSSSGINTGRGELAVAQGFFHSTGNFTSIDPNARGIARLNGSNEWEAVPDYAAMGNTPDFLELMQMDGELCGTQQGTQTDQQFFSRGIACNDGTKWRGLAQGINGLVYDIVKYNGAIVAGGKFSAAGDKRTNFIAEYRNGAWRQLGDGMVFTGATGSNPGDVRAMAVYKGDLYVVGLFNQADGKSTPGLARWDGTDWHSVGEGINNPGFVMLVWDDKLIISGLTGSNKGPILSWDGTTLAEFQDLPSVASWPSAMAIYKGDLIAAYRTSASALVRWTGSAWETFTDVTKTITGDINALLPDGNLLYIGGSGTVGGNIAEQVAVWNGASWAGMGDGLQGGSFGVKDMVFAGDGIIAIGWFDSSGATSVEMLAFFDGTSWFPLGAGLIGGQFIGGAGNTLMIDGSTVYTGGLFEQAGSTWAENIGAFTIKLETVFESGFESN
jgi:hypothetical protein